MRVGWGCSLQMFVHATSRIENEIWMRLDGMHSGWDYQLPYGYEHDWLYAQDMQLFSALKIPPAS